MDAAPVCRNTLPKSERLHLKRDIDRLFAVGQSFVAYPLRVLWGEAADVSAPTAILAAVPKKRIRRAHERNRMKRLIRETYRLNKGMLPKALQIAFMYVANETLPYAAVEKGMMKAITNLNKVLNLVKVETEAQNLSGLQDLSGLSSKPC